MPINPQRVKLDSELADLDQQLQAVDSLPHLSSGQKVVRKGCLQHRRQEKLLEVEIMEQEAVVECRKRDVEAARKHSERTKTPDGLRVLVKGEMRRRAGMAMGGGTHKTYTPLDRLTHQQRVIKIAEGELRRAEYTLRDAQASLCEKTQQLRELQAKDSEWETLVGAAEPERSISAGDASSQAIAAGTMEEEKRKEAQPRRHISNMPKPPTELSRHGSWIRPSPKPAQPPKSPQTNGVQVTTWDAIEISFLSDERVQILDGTKRDTCNYAELGFADRRNGKPNQAWITLRALAEERGIIRDAAKTGQAWPKVEKRIQEIRKVLREHFGIAADPIPFVEGTGYQARFKIGCSPSFHT